MPMPASKERRKIIMRINQLRNIMLDCMFHTEDYGNFDEHLTDGRQTDLRKAYTKLDTLRYGTKPYRRVSKIITRIRREAMMNAMDDDFDHLLIHLSHKEKKEYKSLTDKLYY